MIQYNFIINGTTSDMVNILYHTVPIYHTRLLHYY